MQLGLHNPQMCFNIHHEHNILRSARCPIGVRPYAEASERSANFTAAATWLSLEGTHAKSTASYKDNKDNVQLLDF